MTYSQESSAWDLRLRSAQVLPNALEWRTIGAATVRKYNKNKYLYFPLLGTVYAVHINSVRGSLSDT